MRLCIVGKTEASYAIEKQAYDAKPVTELLAAIQARSIGHYHSIWYSLAERATPDQADKILLAFLRSYPKSLDAYHCATALLSIHGELFNSYFKAERLSHINKEKREWYLCEFQKDILDRKRNGA